MIEANGASTKWRFFISSLRKSLGWQRFCFFLAVLFRKTPPELMNPRILHATALFAMLLFGPAAAFGLGIRIVDQDALATSRGDAFSATADNPSAIYYNPAGITQLEGTEFRLGAYGISLESTVDPALPGAANLDTKFEYQAAPQFYLTYKPAAAPIALGLGVYAPFGFGLEYPDDAPFRTLAKKGRIQYVSINPVFAFEITKTLSLAVGGMVNHGRAKLARGVVTPGDEFHFEGEGVGYGFNAGLLWQPHPMHSFGAMYRSAAGLDFSGHSRVRIPSFTVATPFGPFKVPRFDSESDADLDFDFPQTVVLAYSFRPTPDWNIEFDLDWTDWDSLNTLFLRQSTGDVALPFNWESSFLYEFGVTRHLPAGFNLSAGYVYSENSVPSASFNPLIPDSNRHILSVGVGQTRDRLNWQVAYQYAYGPHRRIENGSLGDGVYRFQSNAITFSVGYRF
jgi:long-chain fatty acid transport protein